MDTNPAWLVRLAGRKARPGSRAATNPDWTVRFAKQAFRDARRAFRDAKRAPKIRGGRSASRGGRPASRGELSTMQIGLSRSGARDSPREAEGSRSGADHRREPPRPGSRAGPQRSAPLLRMLQRPRTRSESSSPRRPLGSLKTEAPGAGLPSRLLACLHTPTGGPRRRPWVPSIAKSVRFGVSSGR